VYTENITIPPKNALPLKDGGYIRITIKDQGVGISQEHLINIFDPFFTTHQRGRGLGVAISYFIIKMHDGHYTYSTPKDLL